MKRKHSNRPSVATTHSRRRFLKGALGAAALLQAPAFIRNSGASKLRKVKFQLAWIPSGEYTPWFAAKEMGVWSDLGLRQGSLITLCPFALLHFGGSRGLAPLGASRMS